MSTEEFQTYIKVKNDYYSRIKDFAKNKSTQTKSKKRYHIVGMSTSLTLAVRDSLQKILKASTPSEVHKKIESLSLSIHRYDVVANDVDRSINDFYLDERGNVAFKLADSIMVLAKTKETEDLAVGFVLITKGMNEGFGYMMAETEDLALEFVSRFLGKYHEQPDTEHKLPNT